MRYKDSTCLSFRNGTLPEQDHGSISSQRQDFLPILVKCIALGDEILTPIPKSNSLLPTPRRSQNFDKITRLWEFEQTSKWLAYLHAMLTESVPCETLIYSYGQQFMMACSISSRRQKFVENLLDTLHVATHNGIACAEKYITACTCSSYSHHDRSRSPGFRGKT